LHADGATLRAIQAVPASQHRRNLSLDALHRLSDARRYGTAELAAAQNRV
jgi:hypothetical protein